jgi:17beta-estradiol 17-dehydrogenase / very-long-chain 3-oxoacyl-CoA reductase
LFTLFPCLTQVKRKSGAIVNQSSAAARFPLPLLAGYSAAKGYIENLTRSCHGEYEAKGIHFQCQSPLWVATPMVRSFYRPIPKFAGPCSFRLFALENSYDF